MNSFLIFPLFYYYELEIEIPINRRRQVILKRMFGDISFHIRAQPFHQLSVGYCSIFMKCRDCFIMISILKSNYGLTKILPHFPIVNEWASLELNLEGLKSAGTEKLPPTTHFFLPRRWLRNLESSLVLVGTFLPNWWVKETESGILSNT